LKVYEINDEEFKNALIMAVKSGDSQRRYELHFTDILYSPIQAFHGKIFPTTLEDIMEDPISHYQNVIRWMYGRGVEDGIKNAMDIKGETFEFAGASGNLDVRFMGIPYEFKTTRYPYTKPLPYPHAVQQLVNYMIVHREPLGRIKMFDMKRLCERTWNVELTKKDIKSRRKGFIKSLKLLKTALYTGDWTILPESTYSWIGRDEQNIIEWLEEHPRSVARACRKWKREAENLRKS